MNSKKSTKRSESGFAANITPVRPAWNAQPQNKNDVTPGQAVILEVSSWEGVSVHEHRFGGVEFRVGRRELGHLHAFIADLPFPRSVRDDLIASGRALPHHVLPESGWVTAPMRTNSEIRGVIELFREIYERVLKTLGDRASVGKIVGVHD